MEKHAGPWCMLQVGAKNRNIHITYGSNDIWTQNCLVSLIAQTEHLFSSPSELWRCIYGWVNGNNYEHLSESFGILPLSVLTWTRLGMLPYNDSFVRETNMKHRCLAKLQGTQIAIMPLTYPEERAVWGGQAGNFQRQPSQIGSQLQTSLLIMQMVKRCFIRWVFHLQVLVHDSNVGPYSFRSSWRLGTRPGQSIAIRILRPKFIEQHLCTCSLCFKFHPRNFL
jgi:hypothetical protein